MFFGEKVVQVFGWRTCTFYALFQAFFVAYRSRPFYTDVQKRATKCNTYCSSSAGGGGTANKNNE